MNDVELVKNIVWCVVLLYLIHEISGYSKMKLFITGKPMFQPRAEQPQQRDDDARLVDAAGSPVSLISGRRR